MGATLSDIHRRIYRKYLEEGLNHEEAVNSFPKPMREQLQKELDMTFIESHYGMKNKWFWIGIGGVLFVTVVLVLLFS